MEARWFGYGAVAAFGLAAVLYVGLLTGAVAPHLGGYDGDSDDGGSYEFTTVRAVDGETGTELGHLEAAIADTFSKRYVGLSETEELPPDRGMLFVHGSADERTYVMRNMSFGIDIIFVDTDGTITEIHEAPAPGPDEDGSQQRYTATGQYVLEAPLGWSADNDIEVGDRIEFDL